jgi:DNA-binding protein HU-beta
MNRSELVAAVAAESGLTQADVNRAFDGLFSVLSDAVGKGTKVSIPGWMSVERTARAARTGRNPQTGETIQIAASNGVKLSAGSKLKAAAK